MIISKEPKKFPNHGEGNCVYCGKTLPPRRRKYCCDEHGWYYRRDIADHIKMWWPDFRDMILKRDKHICQDCEGTAVAVHHITPLYKGGDEFDEDNCISLCDDCHKRRHKKKMFEPISL